VNNALRSIQDQLVRAVHAPGELIVFGRFSLPIARIFPLAKAAEAHLMNRIGDSASHKPRSYRPLSTVRNRSVLWRIVATADACGGLAVPAGYPVVRRSWTSLGTSVAAMTHTWAGSIRW
jgi:hypothetical protein